MMNNPENFNKMTPQEIIGLYNLFENTKGLNNSTKQQFKQNLNNVISRTSQNIHIDPSGATAMVRVTSGQITDFVTNNTADYNNNGNTPNIISKMAMQGFKFKYKDDPREIANSANTLFGTGTEIPYTTQLDPNIIRLPLPTIEGQIEKLLTINRGISGLQIGELNKIREAGRNSVNRKDAEYGLYTQTPVRNVDSKISTFSVKNTIYALGFEVNNLFMQALNNNPLGAIYNIIEERRKLVQEQLSFFRFISVLFGEASSGKKGLFTPENITDRTENLVSALPNFEDTPFTSYNSEDLLKFVEAFIYAQVDTTQRVIPDTLVLPQHFLPAALSPRAELILKAGDSPLQYIKEQGQRILDTLNSKQTFEVLVIPYIDKNHTNSADYNIASSFKGKSIVACYDRSKVNMHDFLPITEILTMQQGIQNFMSYNASLTNFSEVYTSFPNHIGVATMNI